MDQVKNEIRKKTKKAGTEGLTKKERRALRVQQSETENKVINDVQTKQPAGSTGKIDLESNNKSDKCKQTINVKEELLIPKQSNVDVRQKEYMNNVDLEVQRESLHEKQKSAKDVNLPNLNRVSPKSDKVIGDGLSKADLKAKRRALQEAQRLAKNNVQSKVEIKDAKKPEICNRKSELVKDSPKKSINKVQLFNHLYCPIFSKKANGTVNIEGVHAAFLQLGAQYSSKTILGSNARCLALLSALRNLINDFVTPPKQEFCRSIEAALQQSVSYLQMCRPLAVSMTNALRHFKLHLRQINSNFSDNEKRAKLLDGIETYIQDEIAKAGEAISMKVEAKISSEDVILIYGCSSLIRKILLDAHNEGKNFKVIVVDSRPLLEGREMLRKLVIAGIKCTYVLINATSFIMSRATKVLLGAHALLANGYVMSRTGTAQVALIARAYNKPVLVCCETYKFCERVQTDSFVYNELGDPDQLTTIDTLEDRSPLLNWQNNKHLTPLNLIYDVTPPDLVTAVVTELAFLPCTSVPVILRIKPTEIA